jgi:hypothetical protein
VSMQNSRPRFDNNSGHRSSTPTLNYCIIPSEVENGAAGEAAGHRRKGRRLSEREVSESNLLLFFKIA